jgi:hypothetical protein
MVKQIGIFVLGVVVAIALRSAVDSLSAHRSERYFIGDMSTGYVWNDLTRTEKNIYVRAALETLMMSNANGAHISLPLERTYNDFRDGLNQFYSEPANAPLPIPFAFDYIRMKATGTSKEELESILMAARKVANAAAAKAKDQK